MSRCKDRVRGSALTPTFIDQSVCRSIDGSVDLSVMMREKSTNGQADWSVGLELARESFMWSVSLGAKVVSKGQP